MSSSSISISKLRTDVGGRVIGPKDPEYDEARAVFYGGIDRRPAAIVRVKDDMDVSRVVSLARETGVELAVRSGGHSIPGHSVTEGGIVIDLADLRAFDIDVEGRTVWAQTGLTAGEFSAAANAYGLGIGFGDTGSVGIGGITLGGGIGYLVRKHGLTIDDLLAADVVTADGEIRRVDAETEPDLFWAIRGGGGNFGVATRFRFRLHELDTVVGGMLMLPATVDTIAGFMAESEASPEELGTIANVMKAPPLPFVPEEAHGKLVIMALMAYAGDTDAGQRALAPFRALAEPVADMLRPMPYPEVYPPEEEGFHPVATARTMFVDHIGRAEAETILEHLETSTAMMARGAAPNAGRGDGTGAGRCDGVRAPHEPDHGQRRSHLRAARRDRGARTMGRRGSPARSIRATTERTSTSSATRGRSGSARRTRAPRGIA